MEIIAYTIEKRKSLVKYKLSYIHEDIQKFIEYLCQLNLEDYHVTLNNVYIEDVPYEPLTIINSTDDLSKYIINLINNKYLNLSEINTLFVEYNNKMYSPQTINVFQKFFSLFQIEKIKSMSFDNAVFICNMRSFMGENVEKEYNQLDFACENAKALKRLGIDLKSMAKNQMKIKKNLKR